MFKRHSGITSLPINNYFIVNNAQHAYYTRQNNSTQTLIGKHEKCIKCLVSMKYIYGIICPGK